MKDLTSQLFFTEKKNAVYRIIEAVLGEHCYYNKIIKKHFSKNLVMSRKIDINFNQVMNAGYVISCLMQEIIK